MGIEPNEYQAPREEQKEEQEYTILATRSLHNNNVGLRENEIFWRRRYTPHSSQQPQNAQLRIIQGRGIVCYTIGLIVANPPEKPQTLLLYQQGFIQNQNINFVYRDSTENYRNAEAILNTTIEEQDEPDHDFPTAVPAQPLPAIYKSNIHKEYQNFDIHYPDHDQPHEED